MPKKSKKKGRNSNNNMGKPNKSDPIVPHNERLYVFGATAVTGGTPVVAHLDFTIANLGTRAIAMGSQYNLWRIKSLMIRQFVLANTSHTNDLIIQHALAWSPLPFGTVTTNPTTIPEILDFPSSEVNVGNHNIFLRIPYTQLMPSNPSQWLYTQTTGVPASMTSAGCVFSAIASNTGDTSSATHLVIFMNLQFKEPIDTQISLNKELTMIISAPTSPKSNSEFQRIEKEFGDFKLTKGECSEMKVFGKK